MTDKFDLAAMKRDMERPRLTKDWKVISDVPAPGWVQVVGPAFRVAGPTTATDLNGEDYMDRHRDARRIARVPEMEAEILRLRAEVDALEAKLAERVTVKPLEWRDARFSSGPRETAESLLGAYEVMQWLQGDCGGSVPANDPEGSNTEFGGAKSMDEAKAAAQADYNRRILSTITPAPITPAEAARVLLGADDYMPTAAKVAAVKAHTLREGKARPVTIAEAWREALRSIAEGDQ